MVADLLGPHMASDALDDLQQGLGEAVANAIQHGAGPFIQVHVEVTDRQATVRVRDMGNGFDLNRIRRDDPCPAAEAESGRGLHIIKQMSDRVAAYIGPGCIVSISKELHNGSSRPIRSSRPPIDPARPSDYDGRRLV